MSEILKFAIQGELDADDIEADMALAIFAAECNYGRPRVRIETRYVVGLGGQTCVMEVSGAVGESAARVFIGLVTARFGERAFSINSCDPSFHGNSKGCRTHRTPTRQPW